MGEPSAETRSKSAVDLRQRDAIVRVVPAQLLVQLLQLLANW